MNDKKFFITDSFEETQNLGKELAKTLKGGELIALYGNLGSGKTTFVQGLALGLGIKRRIISPTFIIIRSYELRIKNHELRIMNFYHIDLYRIEGEKKIGGLGIDEIIGNSNNIVAVEWAERMREFLPEKRTDIFFEYIDDDKRKITIVKLISGSSK